MAEAIKGDIWSDIACPFCYMGKRKFEAAVSASGVPVDVEFHSFELAPDASEDSAISHAESIAIKMGVSGAEAQAMEDRIVRAGQQVGLELDYSRMIPTKTLKAHELLHYAKAHGRQAAMKERLMSAYFAEGRHVGRPTDLAELAADVGLDPVDALRTLESGEYRDAVAEDIEMAQQLGIRGVPFFVIGGKYAVSGAQDPAVFAQALGRAQEDAG